MPSRHVNGWYVVREAPGSEIYFALYTGTTWVILKETKLDGECFHVPEPDILFGPIRPESVAEMGIENSKLHARLVVLDTLIRTEYLKIKNLAESLNHSIEVMEGRYNEQTNAAEPVGRRSGSISSWTASDHSEQHRQADDRDRGKQAAGPDTGRSL